MHLPLMALALGASALLASPAGARDDAKVLASISVAAATKGCPGTMTESMQIDAILGFLEEAEPGLTPEEAGRRLDVVGEMMVRDLRARGTLGTFCAQMRAIAAPSLLNR